LVATGVRVSTRVHVTARSYTYLVNEINRIFLETITGAGLDPNEFVNNQSVIENGLRTWMTLRQLQVAYLEVFDPRSGAVRTRIDLNIEFTDSGDEYYRTDIERVRGELSAGGQFAGCQYRVIVSTTPGAAVVKGWGETTLRSVDHLTRHDVGEVIGTGAASAAMSVFR
jgi:hypothetical protein